MVRMVRVRWVNKMSIKILKNWIKKRLIIILKIK